MSKPPVIHILCGPTASGKSALALALAEERAGVIMNADSQQLYREFRILTARPSVEDEARVPHKLYGILSAHEAASAGKWLEWAKMEIEWALSQGAAPIVVGGTGLYIRTLMEGIAAIPDVPADIRAQSTSDHALMGGEAFRERLKVVDPILGEKLKPGDTQRLIRAWEVWLGTGKPLSFWQAQGKTAPFPNATFDVRQITLPREELYARINTRCERMLEEGAVEEVGAFLEGSRFQVLASSKKDKPDTWNLTPETCPKIIGIPQIIRYLQGNSTKEEALFTLQQATRNYAKRQLTWFRHQLA